MSDLNISEELQLLENLLNCPSVNSIDNEKNIAKIIYDYFIRHNIDAYMQEIDEGHANVVAHIKGEEGNKKFLFNGHMDTVPYGDLKNWDTDPKKAVLKDGKIYARGASDMKSGLAAMIYALTHLDKKPKNDIVFLATCDEEKNGIGASYFINNTDVKYDYLIIAEPTDMKIGLAHKGCFWFKYTLRGKTSHGAYPDKGVNAIHYAYRLGLDICDYVKSFKSDILSFSTAQIDMISGGIAPNMTADECSAVMDIRPVYGLDEKIFIDKVYEIFNKLKNEAGYLDFDYELLNNRRAFYLKPDDEFVVGFQSLLEENRLDSDCIGINYFTDASIIAKDNYEAKVVLFGPGNQNLAHQPNEYIEVEKYMHAINIYKKICDI